MPASDKQKVALVSMAASAALAGAKLAAGTITGSLGILSEAIHSLIDFGATIITYFAVKWGDQPPDEKHHYGHAKFESIAALVETALLFVTTGWIIYEASHRLFTGYRDVALTWWAFAIVAGSIVIDFNRSRALSRVAQTTSSDALSADALHFSSDMWGSVAVLAGLAAVSAGYPWADSVAALLVAAVVLLAAVRLGRRTLNTLLDTAPEGASERIRAIVNSFDGVLALERLRIRPAGPTLFVSIVVAVRRTTPVEELVRLRNGIANEVRKLFPNADITVTADPLALDDETVYQKVMLIAAQHRLAIHHLTVQKMGSRTAVSFDLEVDGAMTLSGAHEKATRLETAIRHDLGDDVEVESHIEPMPETILEGEDVDEGTRTNIAERLRALARQDARVSEIHNVRVRRNAQGLYVHYHCVFPPEETVETAHDVIDRMEIALQDGRPEIRRVIAHAEPADRHLHH
ncbi:MAG: cation-efflux pump [Hyphomicrobiales bacterium]